MIEENKKLSLWRSRLLPEEYHGTPGEVVDLSDDCALVTCGKGAIYICEVQLDSSEEVRAANVLKRGMILT